MDNRRSFLRLLGLAPIVGTSAVLAYSGDDKPKDELLVFQSDKHKCALSINKDGHLWVKENGTWRRITMT